MEPIVTSSSVLRFFYGTTTLSGDASVFSGVVVHGTDLVFDPETSFPVGGTIDRIDGGAEKDELRGGDCDDMIYGGDANDIIHGDSGEDMLFGGPGKDLSSSW